jgi:choline-sulfatase
MSRWSRRSLLRTLGATAVVACNGPGSARPAKPGPARPPNVVYLYADQHRGTMLGSFGQPFALTPNLDALASESGKFVNMFTNSPLCRPARTVMMTGRMAHVTGCWNNQSYGDPNGPSHVRRARDEAGYLTALIGKGHLTDTKASTMDPEAQELMHEWGFEYVVELLSQVDCGRRGNPYSEWLRDITPDGERSKADRYADYVERWDLLGFPPPDADPWQLGTSDDVDLWTGDQAAQWIRDYADPRPFYLQVNFPGPHSPYDATTEFRDLYDRDAPGFPTAILGPPADPVSPLVQWLWEERPELHGLTAAQSRGLYLTYLSKITMIDQAVGAVVAALDEKGLLDDTWIVYGADHGDLLGDHELWGKVAMYEGAVRTPLLVRPPGGIAPWTSEGLIDQLDVTATLTEILGLDPDGAGQSRLAQWLGGGPEVGKDSVIAEVAGERDGGYRTAMVRRTDVKLVYDFEEQRPVELYDLASDPDEVRNLVLDPDWAAVATDLRDELLDTIAADHAEFG